MIEMIAVVLDRILMSFVARHDETRRRLRLVGVDQMRFARLVIVDVDDDELFAIAWAEADVEPGILFFVDELS